MKTQLWIGEIVAGGVMWALAGCGDVTTPSGTEEEVAREAQPVTGNLNSSPPGCGASICSATSLDDSYVGYCCVCPSYNIYSSAHARMVRDDPLTAHTAYCRESYEACSKVDLTGRTLGHACTCAARSITDYGYMINDDPLTAHTYYCRAP